MARLAYGKRRRQGLSLLELLMVLAILVMVGALAAPAFRRPMENYRLRKAADSIRVAFTRARIRAMKSGQTYMFRYQMSGNTYRMDQWTASSAYLEAGMEVGLDQNTPQQLATADQQVITDPNQENREVDVFMGVQEELPEGVRFAGSDIEFDVRGAMIQEELNPTMMSGASTWSPPILFYPDGTTSDAEVFLTNRNGIFVMVDLRGLTGIAQASDVLTQDELVSINQ